MSTKIEWAEEVINPVIGCSKISAGCQNCYAEKMACRLAHMGNRAYQDVVRWESQASGLYYKNPGAAGDCTGGWNGKTAFVESALKKPLKWKKPRRIFVCSMGDLFHESMMDDAGLLKIVRIFEIMEKCSHHTFMLLTKRPENMKECLGYMYYHINHFTEAMPHVWLGVTAENQETADQRIPILLQIPAAVRFVSVEPMLGPVNLSLWLPNFLDFSYTTDPARLDWIICGGESGPGARPMHPDWARGLRDQCTDAEVPYFFKQWGEYLHGTQDNGSLTGCKKWEWVGSGKDAKNVARVGKKSAGRLLDGQEWNEFPEVR